MAEAFLKAWFAVSLSGLLVSGVFAIWSSARVWRKLLHLRREGSDPFERGESLPERLFPGLYDPAGRQAMQRRLAPERRELFLRGALFLAFLAMVLFGHFVQWHLPGAGP